MTSIRLPCTLPLHVTPQHAREYERVALTVRDQTIALYHDYLQGQRGIDPTKWKLAKQREHVTAYVARRRPTASAFHGTVHEDVASREIRARCDFVPQLQFLTVGALFGSLDDAVFGLAAPTESSMFMRSVSIEDAWVDHRNLREIRLPTASEPFRYTGLKWSQRSASMASLVKARDMTYVEATGFTRARLRNGEYERVAFVVHHSVALPQVPSLVPQGVVRSCASVCTLLREASAGVVEIYATTALAPGGGLPTHVAVHQFVDALVAVCQSTESARKKKLVWMQAARTLGASSSLVEAFGTALELPERGSPNRRPACSHCTRVLPMLRSVATCEICDLPVCARCVTSHKLVFGVHKHRATRVKSLAVCSGCLTTAKNTDNARALAVFEFVAPFDRLRAKSTSAAAAARARSRLTSGASTAASSDTTRSPATTTDSSNRHRFDAANARGPGTAPTVDASDDQYAEPTPPSNLQLWQQLHELCVQAELTYHQTKRHAQRSQSHHGEWQV